MQASTAKNETRLPRAVLKMSQVLNDQIAAREPKTDPADLVPPANEPSIQPANTVDPKTQPAADPRENDPEYWKQRFKVTAGVLTAERESRKAQVVEFNQRLTELQEQIAQLQAKAPTQPTDLGKYFTPEQVEELGEEECRARVAMIERAVADQLAAVVEKEVKPLRDARANQQANEQQDRKAAFLDKLGELVPEYAETDTSDEFHAWLAQVNDDGVLRQAILDTHVRAYNAPMVAKVFQSYLKTKAVPQPPVTPHGSGATGASPTAPSTSLTMPTPAEIRDYFKRAALNKVTDKERVEFDARMKLRTG